jgi:outer membrane murein-binding lipoprotein Lpp
MISKDLKMIVATALVSAIIGSAGTAAATVLRTPTDVSVLQVEVKHLSEQVDRLTTAVESFNMRVDAILLSEMEGRSHASPARR